MAQEKCEVCTWDQASKTWSDNDDSSNFEIEAELDKISITTPYCPFCKLVFDALHRFDEMGVSRATSLPPGIRVRIVIREGRIDYIKGDWEGGPRLEVYADKGMLCFRVSSKLRVYL